VTERENLLRMLAGERTSHLPLDVWLTAPSLAMVEAHRGTRDAVEALGLSVERVGPRFPARPDAWREAYRDLGFAVHPEAILGALGTVDDVPPAHSLGDAYHLLEMRHPLSGEVTVAQLESLPFPDVDSPEPYRHLPDRVAEIHSKGIASIGQMDCTMFEMTWYLRGMDRVFLDLVDGTGAADWLLDWFTHRSEVGVAHYVRAGTDIVWLGDDVGTQRGMMMAVPFWREHMKPRLKRVVEAARNAQNREVWIAYHSDGDIRPIIPDLIEIGIDILNPVQPECMPLGEVVTAYRERLAFWGMIGTQTTMPFGTPDDVRAAVGRVREYARSGCRMVVSPTHAIEPDVPWPNLEALIEDVKKPLFGERL
jgi:uroporphyrinogen decarboxylase